MEQEGSTKAGTKAKTHESNKRLFEKQQRVAEEKMKKKKMKDDEEVSDERIEFLTTSSDLGKRTCELKDNLCISYRQVLCLDCAARKCHERTDLMFTVFRVTEGIHKATNASSILHAVVSGGLADG